MRRIGVWCLLCMLWTLVVQAQESVTLTNPIAYIGRDGNIYVTDGTTSLPVTTNAGDEFGQAVLYAQPRWSPDGTRLVFFRDPLGEGRSMMLVESGNSPQELVGASDGVFFENRVIAWSPDNDEVAFIGTYGEQWGLFGVSVDDGSIRQIAEPMGPSIGEAGGDDPARVVVAREDGRSPYRERYELNWTDEGILLSPTNSCICLQLMTPDGEGLDEWAYGSGILASVGDPFVFERLDYQPEQPPVLVDVAHPAEVPLELPAEARPMAFMDGAFYYVTRTDVQIEESNFETQTGIPFEEQLMWSFAAESATLQLWRDNPSGDDILVFETQGFNFGVVRPTADNRLLVSVISSNREALIAINGGATLEEVQDLTARPITYVLDGDEVILTLEGGQPDASSGMFTVMISG